MGNKSINNYLRWVHQNKLKNMKKLFTILFAVAAMAAKAQDSTVITVSPQARDLEAVGVFISSNNSYETIYHTVKLKFRVQVTPTGTDAVSITGYTIDFILLYELMNNNITMVKQKSNDRLKTLLLAVAQSYLTGKLNGFDTADTNEFQALRAAGRFRYKKNNN